jgi:O-antigen/teichoic acid export membrane protein
MFINGVVTSIFLAKKRYLDLFVISLLSSATSLAFYYIAKEFEQNVASVGLLLMMLYQSIEVLAKLYFSTVDFRRIFENFRITRESRVGLKNNINFVMPLIFASTVNSVVFFYSRIWLSNQSNGLAELASFDVAFQFLIIQMLFLNTVTNVVIGYSKNINNENHQLLINIGLGALFSVVSWAFLYVFRDQLISIFGEGYSGYILPILTSASIFYAVAIAFNRKYVSTKHRKVLSVVSIVSSISMLVFMLNNAANAVNLSIGYIVYYVSSVVVYLLYFFGRSVFFVK